MNRFLSEYETEKIKSDLNPLIYQIAIEYNNYDSMRLEVMRVRKSDTGTIAKEADYYRFIFSRPSHWDRSDMMSRFMELCDMAACQDFHIDFQKLIEQADTWGSFEFLEPFNIISYTAFTEGSEDFFERCGYKDATISLDCTNFSSFPYIGGVDKITLDSKPKIDIDVTWDNLAYDWANGLTTTFDQLNQMLKEAKEKEKEREKEDEIPIEGIGQFHESKPAADSFADTRCPKGYDCVNCEYNLVDYYGMYCDLGYLD